MLVREAKSQDFDALMRLYRQLHADDPILSDGSDREVFARIQRSDNLHLFLLEADGRIHSTCYLNIIPNITRSARPFAIIENVVTDASQRGRGFGTRVVRHALDFAWSQGCYKAMLQTASKEESTHAFYRACGFSANEKVGYVARPTDVVSTGA